MNIFGDMMQLWIFLGVITKIDFFGGSFLYILEFFLKVKIQKWITFLRLLNFKYLGYA